MVSYIITGPMPNQAEASDLPSAGSSALTPNRERDSQISIPCSVGLAVASTLGSGSAMRAVGGSRCYFLTGGSAFATG